MSGVTPRFAIGIYDRMDIIPLVRFCAHYLAFIDEFTPLDEIYGFIRVLHLDSAGIRRVCTHRLRSMHGRIMDLSVVGGLIGMIKVNRIWWILDRDQDASYDAIVRDQLVND